MKRSIGALLLAGVLAAPFTAHAAGVSETGWWTRNPAASNPPEGGIAVANAPDGVVSYGAVRVSLDGGSLEKATVAIKEAGSQLNAGGAALRACPAVGTWKAGRGSLAEGPKADCAAGSVALTRDAPSATWNGDVTSLLSGGSTAIAVVPAAGASVFQLGFDKPAVAITLASSSGSPSSESSPVMTTEAAPASGSDPVVSDAGSFTTFDSAPTATLDAPVTATAASPAGGTSATPATPVAATSASVASQETALPVRPASAVDGTGNPWLQFAFFVVVAALAGTVAGVARHRLTMRAARVTA